MKVRKTVNSILVLGVVAAVLALAAGLIRKSDERVAEHGGMNTASTATESLTTFSFPEGSVIGRVGALGVGADAAKPNGLEGRIDGALTNRLNHPLRIRDVEAVTRGTGESLRQFRFSFEKATLEPGQRAVFAGAVAVSAEFFNQRIRGYDVMLRVVTDIGAFELPLENYTLEVEPAIAAGLLRTNHVRFGEAEGMIHFLSCDQASAREVCEPMLEQMGLPGI